MSAAKKAAASATARRVRAGTQRMPENPPSATVAHGAGYEGSFHHRLVGAVAADLDAVTYLLEALCGETDSTDDPVLGALRRIAEDADLLAVAHDDGVPDVLPLSSSYEGAKVST